MRASLSLTRRYFQKNSLKVSADRCAMRLERLEFAHIACATLWRALAMSIWSPDRQLYQHSFGIRQRSLGMHPINPLAVVLDVEARDSITAGVTFTSAVKRGRQRLAEALAG